MKMMLMITPDPCQKNNDSTNIISIHNSSYSQLFCDLLLVLLDYDALSLEM